MTPKLNFEKFLIDHKLLTAETLRAAQNEASGRKVSLFTILVEKAFLSEEALGEALSKFHGVRFVPGPLPLNKDLLGQIPVFTLRRYRVIPLGKTDTEITIATANPGNFLASDEIRRLSKLKVNMVATTESAINEALTRLSEEAPVGTPSAHHAPVPIDEGGPAASRLEQTIARSISRGASDIHFEPQQTFALVRERIDGVLYEVERMSLEAFWPLLSRLKLLSGMDIVEKRLAQDGRFRFNAAGGKNGCEIRGATLPTIYGEKMVLRLLRTDKADPSLELLDVGPERLSILKRVCHLTDGLILAAGPTGCGKTTTIYAMLSTLDRKTQNVIMIEDPVEFELEMANQVQVNTKIGVTFSSILPAILRQDPDVLMVGEMRDEPTAQMVMRSAISGHLVFSTIHAPTAIQTVARLLDMGVQAHMVVASLQVCISQRLLRKLCLRCRKPRPATLEDKRLLGISENQNLQIYEEKGCDTCHGLGYLGRFAAMEILLMTDQLRDSILRKELKGMETIARQAGYRAMREHAAERVIAGETSIRELVSNCPM